MQNSPTVAFIVQRYGSEIMAGAEVHCRWICERLARRLNVEVLTTCAVDDQNWGNVFPAGTEKLNGVLVRRFPVSLVRNKSRYEPLDKKIYNRNNGLSKEEELQWMHEVGPYSHQLFSYLEEHKSSYACFIFFTYLFATTFFGMPLVREKAFLVPTAHDEPFIYLSIFDDLFKLPQGIFFNSVEEKEFVHRRFHNQKVAHVVVGAGITPPERIVEAEVFRKKYDLSKPYIIYLGRIGPGKGCHDLCDLFLQYKEEGGMDVQLALLGKQEMEIPSHPDIRYLGSVPEEDKFSGLAGAQALVNHSLNESLSLVLLESWSVNTPVLVNGNCDVLVGQCKRSNGGLWYRDFHEFKFSLNWLLRNKQRAREMGLCGKEYLHQNYNWDLIEEKYLSLLKKFL